MKDRIKDFIKERRGGVSFVELERLLEEAGAGDLAMCLSGNENIILWTGMNEAFYDAMTSLLADKAIRMKPTDMLVYIIDGKCLDLPTARQRRKYKKPHWLPVVFNPS